MKGKAPVTILRLVVGTVVLVESIRLIFAGPEAAAFSPHVLPDVFRLTLGWSETVAAMLFLFPLTVRVGAIVLLIIFAVAILIHAAHGQFQFGGLVVDAAAVLVVLNVCLSGQDRKLKRNGKLQ